MLHSTMTEPRLLAVASLLIFVSSSAWARTWQDVVDPTIFLASAIDMGRLESSLEKDPFDFRPQPTASPTYAVEESGSSPTPLPSLAPTQADTSSSPTASPTARYEFVVGNGGCPAGLTLFEIRFVDSWGDGWGSTSLEISESSPESNLTSGDLLVLSTETSASYVSQTVKGYRSSSTSSKVVFSGSLARGNEAYKYACLDVTKCFSVQVGGGAWEDEAKWEIRMVKLGVPREGRDNSLAAAKGLAPAQCQFSVPNKVSDELPCPVTCGEKQTPFPSDRPTELPTGLPTAAPSTSTPTTANDVPDSWRSLSDFPSSTPSFAR